MKITELAQACVPKPDSDMGGRNAPPTNNSSLTVIAWSGTNGCEMLTSALCIISKRGGFRAPDGDSAGR